MNRNRSIDFFRGLFLVVMMIDHLQIFGFKSMNFLYQYTFEPLGFVSAAEGFVFISGLMAGIVYGKIALKSLKEFKHKVWERIKVIWLSHFKTVTSISLLFSIPAFNQMWNHQWQGKLSLWKEAPFKAWFHASALLYQSSFVDVLPLYILLMVFLMKAIPELVKGRLMRVLGVSLVLWLAGQFYPQEALGNRIGHLLGWFEVLSWQFLFIGAAIIGFLKLKGGKIPIDPKIFVFSFILSSLFFYIRHFKPSLLAGLPLDPLNVRNFGALRITNFVSLAYVCFYLSQRFGSGFYLKPINLLGRNSLGVFSFHLFVVYGLGACEEVIAAQSMPIRSMLFLFALGSLYIPIVWKKYYKPFCYRAVRPLYR